MSLHVDLQRHRELLPVLKSDGVRSNIDSWNTESQGHPEGSSVVMIQLPPVGLSPYRSTTLSVVTTLQQPQQVQRASPSLLTIVPPTPDVYQPSVTHGKTRNDILWTTPKSLLSGN